MFKLILELIILACFCNGLHLATEEGMIFYRPAKWLNKKLASWITKPLFNCVYCMASIWGVVTHLVLIGFSELQLLPLIVVCGVFVNGLFSVLYNVLYEKWVDLKNDFNNELNKLD